MLRLINVSRLFHQLFLCFALVFPFEISAGFVDPSVLKGSDPSPGTSCNGHSGYLATGGGG